MYQSIYNAYCKLSKGDQAALKRCRLDSIADCPAYFSVLKLSGAKDNQQTQRILYLLESAKITQEDNKQPLAEALLAAGVKENHVIQIVRSGDNGIDYLKRQLIRCENLCLDSLGQLAQFWGDYHRRKLLKNFILSQPEQ